MDISWGTYRALNPSVASPEPHPAPAGSRHPRAGSSRCRRCAHRAARSPPRYAASHCAPRRHRPSPARAWRPASARRCGRPGFRCRGRSWSPSRPGTCARWPSADCARRSRAAAASRAGRLCRPRRRCRNRASRAASRCRDGTRAARRPSGTIFQSGLTSKPTLPSHSSMPDWVSAGISLISPHA